MTGTPAWHKLGQVVANAVTSAQAIELARLNWEVEQWELKAFDRELGFIKGERVPAAKSLPRLGRRATSVSTTRGAPPAESIPLVVRGRPWSVSACWRACPAGSDRVELARPAQ